MFLKHAHSQTFSVANLGYHIICVNVENLKMINEIVKIIVK